MGRALRIPSEDDLVATFFDYFQENMAAIYLPVPTTGWDTAQSVFGNLGAIQNFVTAMGPTATLGDLVAAGYWPQLSTVAAVFASFYSGAAAGSLMVATGKKFGDAIETLSENGLGTAIWDALQQIPEEELPKNGPEHPVGKRLSWYSVSADLARLQEARAAQHWALRHLLQGQGSIDELGAAVRKTVAMQDAFDESKRTYSQEWNTAWP